MKRRSFLKRSLSTLAAVPALRFSGPEAEVEEKKTKIAIVKTQDRAPGVGEAIGLLDLPPMKGKRIFLKPNFNTADPFPAGTHHDTLTALVREIKSRGPAGISPGGRSGPPPTQKGMGGKGSFAP